MGLQTLTNKKRQKKTIGDKKMKNLKNIIAIVALAVLCIGCEVTPYKHIIKSEAGNDIGIRCALVGGIPVACAFFHETKVEVPIEVLVGVVVERVVEVEKVVEVQTIVEKETIVESITTEYINTEIDANTFVAECYCPTS